MHYIIKAYRATDGITLLRLPARDIDDACRQAESKGYRVISVRKRTTLPSISTHTQFSATLFSQELLGLLEAGLNLLEAIQILSRKSRSSDSRKILETLAQHLHEGLSFSRALERMPQIFPPLFVVAMRTSEQTGDLVTALQRYLAYRQQIDFVRGKVISASVYPVLLIAVGMMVMLFMLAYVVPRFSRIYEDLGHNLPWLSRLLMYWGQFFEQNTVSVIAISGSMLMLFVYGVTRPGIRSAMMRIVWLTPAIGERIRVYQLARFTRTLAMLIDGGIPFVKSLEMTADLLRQPALRQGVDRAAQSIREGHKISEMFAANGLATEVGVRLLSVGERSGNLGQTMERIAKLYDDEVARWVDWFSRLIEPVLMIVIGFSIGIIVLLMYLPIFELANSI